MENTPSPADEQRDAPAADQITSLPENQTEQSEQSPGDRPHPDDYDSFERRRFGPVGVVPASPWLTVALCLAFVGILLYGAISGNGLAFVLVAVVAVFIGVPYLLLYLFNGKRLPPRAYVPPADNVDAVEHEWPDDQKADTQAADARESLDSALPAAGLGEPNTGNGHKK